MISKIVGIILVIMGILVFLSQGVLFLQEKKIRLKNWIFVPFYLGMEIVCWFLASFGVSDTATNMLVYPFRENVPIRLLPGTIVVGATVPMCIMSYSYLNKGQVGATTLLSLVLAQGIGSVLGARVITKMNAGLLRKVLGCALIVAAVLLLFKMFFLHSEGGNVQSLSTRQLIFMFFFMIFAGILAMVGVGSTIPNMAVLLTLGMPPLAIYPIIMSANCATCLAGCFEFIKEKAVHPQVVLIESIGGVIGVFLAMRFVAHVNTTILQFLMIVVMLTSALQMFKSHSDKEE